MNNVYKTLAVAAIALGMSATMYARQQDWANFNRYAQANKEVISSPDTGRRVVFLGKRSDILSVPFAFPRGCD